MPALNFQERFAPMIVSGQKRQTIRAARKRPIIAGDNLILYTGMRTKRCHHLDNVKCQSTDWCRVWEWGCEIMTERDFIFTTPKDLDRFARKDGFKDWPEMRAWFKKTHGLPFMGVLIKW